MGYAILASTVLGILLLTETCCSTRVDRPRGVSLTKKIFYDNNKDFICLDGSRTMPFSHVNDDYCDCFDGTDEPGTSACPDGQFHCTNAGFKPKNIPSSRVNDGICDCCDGSDEWRNQSLCPDACKELWKATREDLQKQAEAANRGVAIRKEYSDRGIAKSAENQQKLEELRHVADEIKQFEEELKLKKEDAEKAEREAKNSEKVVWNNFKEKIKQQQESRQAADAFTELDGNKDGSVSVDELQIHSELDPNPDDDEFTVEEAKLILGGESAEAPHFIESAWKSISRSFVHMPSDEKDAEQRGVNDEDDDDEDLDEDEGLDEDDEHDDLDDEEDGEYYPDDEHHYEQDLVDDVEKPEESTDLPSEEIQVDKPAESETEKKEAVPEVNLPDEPVWSDAAKILIEAAESARKEHEENQRKKSDAEKQISALEKKLNMDFGPDKAYHELHGNCYELDTHEYTYKLCPFDRVVQKSKSGGSETNLGRWDSWNGPQGSKYSSMKYLNGLKCWNGPDRSAGIKISCGDENKLLSASEPSRCEYRLEFATPAACETVHVPEYPHDEL